ncbi:MAG: A/G-specific adenine glycosylase [Proteobacteria bacterium]|nr:A/G-specific adenine glycosylase [Pseudomonadota bacterium]
MRKAKPEPLSRRRPPSPPLAPATQAIEQARPALHRWYRAHARDLPWRRTRDPYAIWISEVMLQQTQVATVVPYYERWLSRFPEVAALAAAAEDEVLRLWQGLGYYRRARFLHRAARVVVAEHGGKVPLQREALAALPGVGDYTLAAILSIADGQAFAVVDGNVRRVLARVMALDAPADRGAGAAALTKLADTLLWPADPGLHNQALMELGARVCSPRAPGCEACPLSAACAARREGHPERYPLRAPRRVVPHRWLIAAVLVCAGRVLLHRRPYEGLLGGLWDLPTLPLAEGQVVEPSAQRRALRSHLRLAFGLSARIDRALEPVPHAFTHLRVTIAPYRCSLRPPGRAAPGACAESAAGTSGWRWVAWPELDAHALPRATQKVLAQLGAERGRDSRALGKPET